MVGSENDEKARQETEADTTGEQTCALRRGAKEGVGSEEITEEIIEAGFHAICESNFDMESYSKIAERVYMAMLKAQHS